MQVVQPLAKSTGALADRFVGAEANHALHLAALTTGILQELLEAPIGLAEEIFHRVAFGAGLHSGINGWEPPTMR